MSFTSANKNIKVRFCRSALSPNSKCVWGERCIFAHTIGEIRPLVCFKAVNDCKVVDCDRIHSNESITQYSARIMFPELNARDDMDVEYDVTSIVAGMSALSLGR
jgi:hypothetical protein